MVASTYISAFIMVSMTVKFLKPVSEIFIIYTSMQNFLSTDKKKPAGFCKIPLKMYTKKTAHLYIDSY